MAETTPSNPLRDIPVEVTVSVGQARPLVGDLMDYGPNSVLPLDKRIEDPVDLFIGGRLIARGHLEQLEGPQAGQLAVRLTEVISAEPSGGN